MSLEYGEDTCTPSHLTQAGKTGSHVAQAGPEPLIPSLQSAGWRGYVMQDPRAWRMLAPLVAAEDSTESPHAGGAEEWGDLQWAPGEL